MTSQKERIASTDEAIINALIQVGETKPLAQISISDISRKSGINRGTFYLHYLDKNDLVSQLCDKLAQKFSEILRNEMSGAMDISYLTTNKPYPIIKDLIAMVDQNKALLRFLWGPNGDASFYPRITEMLQDAILAELGKLKGSPNFRADVPNHYAIRLVTSATMTVVSTWISEENSPLDQEAVAVLVMQTLYLSPYEMLGLTNNKNA